MTRTADRLADVRAVHRGRGGPTFAGLAYAVYVVVIAGLVIGVPVGRGVVLELSSPEVLRAFRSAGAVHVVAVAGGLAAAGFAALGSVRGPALMPPFLLTALTGSDMPRRAVLARPFHRSAAGLTALVAAVAAVPAAVLVGTGAADLGSGTWFVGAAAAFGALMSLVWLLGQRLAFRADGGSRTWVLTAALLATALLTAVLPGVAVILPWGWLARAWPSAPPDLHARPFLLLALALIAWPSAGALRERLGAPLLLAQSLQWQAAGSALGAADLAGALGTFRVLPRVGRRWRAVGDAPPVLRFLVRDAVGAARTPGRLAVGMASVALGGFVAAAGQATTGVTAALAAAAGAVVGFAALGSVTDGFRHAADAAAHPALYGVSTARLAVLHAGLPVAVAAVAGGAGVGAAVVLGAPPVAAATCLVLGLFLVVVRAFHSAKGPLPPELLTPMPSPMGDVSGASVVVWQIDAVLIAVVASQLAVPGRVSSASGVIALLAAALIVVALTGRRLRRL